MFIRSLILATALACAVPAAQAQTSPYHTYPQPAIAGQVDPSYMAGQHAKVIAGTARQHERHEAYLAAHPDHVSHRVGPDPHAARMAKQYNMLMGRCQAGDRLACTDSWAWRPGQ